MVHEFASMILFATLLPPTYRREYNSSIVAGPSSSHCTTRPSTYPSAVGSCLQLRQFCSKVKRAVSQQQRLWWLRLLRTARRARRRSGKATSITIQFSASCALEVTMWAKMDGVLRKAWKLTMLTAKSILPDLLCFTPLEATGLIIFAASSIVFSFIDFNHITDPENNPSIYNTVNDRLAGLEQWRRILMCLSGGAAFTGVLCVVLTTKGKISAFFWGIINSLLYGLFAYAYGYAGDAQLNLFFFLPIQFWGIWCWGENLLENDDDTVQSRQLNLWQWIICVVIAGAITVGFYYEIPVFAVSLSGVYYFEGEDVPRSLDSIVNALSMIGQVLSIYRYNEQWYFWLAVDVLQIAMFTGVAGYGIVINVVVMWILFTLNAMSGLYAWQVRYWNEDRNVSSGDNTDNENNDVENNFAKKDKANNKHGSKYSKLPTSDGQPTVLFTKNSLLTGNDVNTVNGSDKLENIDDVREYDAYCTSGTDPFVLCNAKNGFLPPYKKKQDHVNNGNAKGKIMKGAVVGKFWPFHRGHQHLLDTAATQCDELYVILCHRPYHHPPAYLVQQVIRETCPTVYTMVIRDVYDPYDSNLWATLTATWCGFIPDKVFTSESYGITFAKALSGLEKEHHCEHVMCDVDRLMVPISGTALRRNPYIAEHWRYLPPLMRNFYCRRLVFVGAESTGKTTLSQKIAEYFQCPWVAEYGREFCELQLEQRQLQKQNTQHNLTFAEVKTDVKEEDPEEFSFTDDDFFTIMTEQCKREMLATQTTDNGVVVCDTDAWATLRWFERYQHRQAPASFVAFQADHRAKIANFVATSSFIPSTPVISTSTTTPQDITVKEYKDFTETVLYILCDVEGSMFVQDGLRDGRHIRETMHADFEKHLKEEQLPFFKIDGPFEKRFEKTIAALKERQFFMPEN